MLVAGYRTMASLPRPVAIPVANGVAAFVRAVMSALTRGPKLAFVGL